MSYAEYGHRGDGHGAVAPLALPFERTRHRWPDRLRCGLLGHDTAVGIGGLVLRSATCRRCGAPVAD